MSVESLLGVMEQMKIQAQGVPSSPFLQTTQEPAQIDFASTLKQAIDGVSDQKSEAGSLMKSMLAGDSSIALHDVVVADQKASVSFNLAMRVRNDLLSAYKELSSIPV